MITRRHFIKLSAGTVGLSMLGLPRMALASAPTDKRLVFIFLRGGLDGLFAVPSYGDPRLVAARPALAIPSPGTEGGALKLSGLFGLHPALQNLHALYQQKQLTVFHAVASPYRERSHFDAQDLLENGTTRPHGRASGWLNAALQSLPQSEKASGIALGPSVPLVLQGKAEAMSWAPSTLPEPPLDMMGHLSRLYANDPMLKQALADAQQIQNKMGQSSTDSQQQQAFIAYMHAAGKFLSDPNGPRVATVDLGGFDTHGGQADPNCPLITTMKLLDSGIGALREQLGNNWHKTAVLIVTEFGRTVAMNGSRGTDHGTGTVAFLAGGAVKGGQVIADWPGLAQKSLYQNRDLYPTTDLRRIQMAVLRDHLGVSEAALHQDIFPDSGTLQPWGDALFI